jgi:hypothetical protein
VKRSVSIAASLGLLLLALGGIASCKQGEGERCQLQSDCEEGLTCNLGEGVCRRNVEGALDAQLPPDAPADAAVDAPDAM